MTPFLETFPVFRFLSKIKQKAKSEEKKFLLTVIGSETKRICWLCLNVSVINKIPLVTATAGGPSLANRWMVLSPILQSILTEGRKCVCISTIIFAPPSSIRGSSKIPNGNNDLHCLRGKSQRSSGDSLLQTAGVWSHALNESSQTSLHVSPIFC